MNWNSDRRGARSLWACWLLAVVLAVTSGCGTVGFYAQAAKGEFQILAHQKSVDRLIAMKRLAGRSRDLEDVANLERLRSKKP